MGDRGGPPDSSPDTTTKTSGKAVDTSGAGQAYNQRLERLSPARRAAAAVQRRDQNQFCPVFLDADDEVVHSNGNAYIVLGGGDRLSSINASRTGETHHDKIDLVVGRMGAFVGRRSDQAGESIPGPGYASATQEILNQDPNARAEFVEMKSNYVDPNPKLDAARIYISSRTDIDEAFDLPDGSIGCPKNRSAIGLKADGIRIIGREGIKLVTYTDTANSRGGEVTVVNGIDLLAGGSAMEDELQPLVKGDNVRDAIEELVDGVAKVMGLLNDFLNMQMSLNEKIMMHNHNSPFYGIESSPSKKAARGSAAFMMKTMASWIPNGHVKNLMEPSAFKRKYLVAPLGKSAIPALGAETVGASMEGKEGAFGEKYINSLFNNTT